MKKCPSCSSGRYIEVHGKGHLIKSVCRKCGYVNEHNINKIIGGKTRT